MGLLLVSGYYKIYFLLPKRRYNIPIVSNLALEEPANLTKILFLLLLGLVTMMEASVDKSDTALSNREEEEELGIYEDKGSGTDLSDTETVKPELDEVGY